jgi:DnaJ-class molecular chaperone
MKNLSVSSRLATLAACASSMHATDVSCTRTSMVGEVGQSPRQLSSAILSSLANENAVVDGPMTKDIIITSEDLPNRESRYVPVTPAFCQTRNFQEIQFSAIPTSRPVAIPRGGGTAPDSSEHDNADGHHESDLLRNKGGSEISEEKTPKYKKKNKKTTSNQPKKSSFPSETQEHRSNSKKDEKHHKKNRKNEEPKQDTQKSFAIVEEIMKRDDFYSILGVSTSATDRDITKAYRRRCVQTHPDKTGGDRRAFDRVAEAYEVLSDAQKRQMYNRFGKAGLTHDGGLGGAAGATAGSYQDVFRSMFQHATQRQQQTHHRNASLRYQLQVTLEDLYHGTTQIVMVTPPPSFRHQQHHQSSRRKQKKVDVHIPKGSVSGQSIVLSGEVDFNDDITPGDLIFVLSQAAHHTYTRKGHDLAMELTIDLEEAICGMQRPILHLNGEDLLVESARTAQGHPMVIQTGDVHVLKGWGMPKRNQSGEFGDLYIQYRVEMPKANQGDMLSGQELKDLSRLLKKIQGKNTRISHRGIGRKQRKSSRKELDKVSVDGDGNADGDAHSEDEQHVSDEKVHVLLDAKPSDFGTASGKIFLEEDDDVHGHDSGEGYHPFPSAASGFFGGNSGSTFGSYYFGNFGTPAGDDDENAQCRQM